MAGPCLAGRSMARRGLVTLAAAAALTLSGPGAARVPSPALAQDQLPAVWQQLAADAPGPGPRWDHTLGADEAGRQLVVFGGGDAAGGPLGDTWLFDLAAETWNQVAGPAPSPRFGHAVAVDLEERVLYLFGGQADGATFFDDTWRLDLERRTWSELDTGDGPRPSPRYGTSAVIDGHGHLLVSHGFTFEGRFDDTWSLDLRTGAWSDISPTPETRPLKCCLHKAVWDTAGERMMLFGGCSSGFGPYQLVDLCSFDSAARTWAEITPTTGPAPRSNPALVLDADHERVLLIDGLTEAGYVADIWALRLGGNAMPSWEQAASGGEAPAPRASHDATVVHQRVYLFGGNTDSGPVADLWAMSLSAS